jgi:phosphoribosylglycinamide formyltransferase-1
MSAGAKLRVAALISGRGSNMAAIAGACTRGVIAAEVVGVIADRVEAPGIALAQGLGLATQIIAADRFPDRTGFEAALAEAIDGCNAELIVLAGFMRILSAPFVQRYADRLLNIHPSLLPKYKGLHTHRRVLQAGEREHGVSVHLVTPELDGGPVICQARVAVMPGDTESRLAARVQVQEHRIYPMVVGLIAAGRLQLKAGSILLDGRALAAPLVTDDEPGVPVHV